MYHGCFDQELQIYSVMQVCDSVANVAGNTRNSLLLKGFRGILRGLLVFRLFLELCFFWLYFLYKCLCLIVILTMKKLYLLKIFFACFFWQFSLVFSELFASFHRERQRDAGVQHRMFVILKSKKNTFHAQYQYINKRSIACSVVVTIIFCC